MGNEWDGRPQWQKEGRVGPNGARASGRKARNQIRSGRDKSAAKKGSGYVSDDGCVVLPLALAAAGIAYAIGSVTEGLHL